MSVHTSPASMGAHSRVNTYKDIGAILGANGVDYAIIPVGDTKHENAARTTVTTVGAGAGNGLVFTYSEARTAFDLATQYRHNQLQLPTVPFNGTDEEADSPDAAFWSRVGLPFSVGCWVNLVDNVGVTFLSKWDAAASTREWVHYLASDKKNHLQLWDESGAGSATISIRADDDAPLGVSVFFVTTYDGGAFATGMKAYQDGGLSAAGETEDAFFVAPEDLGGTVKLAHFNAIPTTLLDGSYLGGPLGPFFSHQVLSPSQIAGLHRIGVAAQQ